MFCTLSVFVPYHSFNSFACYTSLFYAPFFCLENLFKLPSSLRCELASLLPHPSSVSTALGRAGLGRLSEVHWRSSSNPSTASYSTQWLTLGQFLGQKKERQQIMVLYTTQNNYSMCCLQLRWQWYTQGDRCSYLGVQRGFITLLWIQRDIIPQMCQGKE